MPRASRTGPHRPSIARRSSVPAWLCCAVVLVLAGCRTDAGMTGDDPTPGEAADRFAAIAALEASIERDHRALEDMISAPGQAADDSLHDNPELRAIADRLTKQERMLEALKSTVDAEPGPVR